MAAPVNRREKTRLVGLAIAMPGLLAMLGGFVTCLGAFVFGNMPVLAIAARVMVAGFGVWLAGLGVIWLWRWRL